jgi:hypothetical protein
MCPCSSHESRRGIPSIHPWPRARNGKRWAIADGRQHSSTSSFAEILPFCHFSALWPIGPFFSVHRESAAEAVREHVTWRTWHNGMDRWDRILTENECNRALEEKRGDVGKEICSWAFLNEYVSHLQILISLAEMTQSVLTKNLLQLHNRFDMLHLSCTQIILMFMHSDICSGMARPSLRFQNSNSAEH